MQYVGHKFSSARDEFLSITAPDFSADHSGNVEAPTGWFALTIIDATDLPDIAESAQELVIILTRYEPNLSTLVGNFIIREDSNGYVTVESFDTSDQAHARFEELNREYLKWDAQDDADFFTV